MVPAGDRLLFVDVDRGGAGAPGLQGGDQRTRLDQFGARDIDQERGRLHPRQIGGGDDAVRLRVSRTSSCSTSARSNNSAWLAAVA